MANDPTKSELCCACRGQQRGCQSRVLEARVWQDGCGDKAPALNQLTASSCIEKVLLSSLARMFWWQQSNRVVLHPCAHHADWLLCNPNDQYSWYCADTSADVKNCGGEAGGWLASGLACHALRRAGTSARPVTAALAPVLAGSAELPPVLLTTPDRRACTGCGKRCPTSPAGVTCAPPAPGKAVQCICPTSEKDEPGASTSACSAGHSASALSAWAQQAQQGAEPLGVPSCLPRTLRRRRPPSLAPCRRHPVQPGQPIRLVLRLPPERQEQLRRCALPGAASLCSPRVPLAMPRPASYGASRLFLPPAGCGKKCPGDSTCAGRICQCPTGTTGKDGGSLRW